MLKGNEIERERDDCRFPWLADQLLTEREREWDLRNTELLELMPNLFCDGFNVPPKHWPTLSLPYLPLPNTMADLTLFLARWKSLCPTQTTTQIRDFFPLYIYCLQGHLPPTQIFINYQHEIQGIDK